MLSCPWIGGIRYVIRSAVKKVEFTNKVVVMLTNVTMLRLVSYDWSTLLSFLCYVTLCEIHYWLNNYLVMPYAILGFALTEAALMMGFLILFVFILATLLIEERPVSVELVLGYCDYPTSTNSKRLERQGCQRQRIGSFLHYPLPFQESGEPGK